jgi:NADH pyrophosphatase NudC (nudix superfamily)
MRKTDYQPKWNPAFTGPKPKTIKAYDFGIPGLVVFKSGKNWNIGHTSSGRNVISDWFTKRKDAAEAALVAQDEIPMDWTKSQDQLLREQANQWYEVLKYGYVQPSAEPYIYNWTYVELTSFAMDGISEGLCGACGEVSGNHEPDARNNWCPCCGEKEVTSALVMAGMI